MHFTVLTAVTLPENCGQAINLPATVRINELVAALRRARFGDNAAKDALDSELVETQVRFEQMVEDLVDNRLLPYCENIEDRAYLEFVDCTEECRREYENDGEVNQPRPVLCDCLFYALVGKGKLLLGFVND